MTSMQIWDDDVSDANLNDSEMYIEVGGNNRNVKNKVRRSTIRDSSRRAGSQLNQSILSK